MPPDALPNSEAATPAPRWCLVGNIVAERPFGEGGVETRQGTRHFVPGAKVYGLPARWGDGYRKIVAVGRHRGSRGRALAAMVIRSDWVTNWRAKVVHDPAVLRALAAATKESRQPGWSSREHFEEYLAALQERKVKRREGCLVYVGLIDEGTEVWRPVAAERVGPGLFRLLGGVPAGETWRHRPGEVVRCEPRRFSDGSTGLAALPPPP